MITVDAYPLAISLIPRYDLCLYEEVELEVVNAAPVQELIYDWWPDTLFGDPPYGPVEVVSPGEDTEVSVAVTNQYGCEDTLTTFIHVIDVYTGLFASAEPDTVFRNSGETSQLTTIDIPDYIYYWEPDATLSDPSIFNPIASPPNAASRSFSYPRALRPMAMATTMF